MATVRTIMHEGVTYARRGDTLQTVAMQMRDLDIGALPVCDDTDKLVGFLTDRDIATVAVAAGMDPVVATVREFPDRPVHTADVDVEIDDALALMEQHRIRRLPVTEGDRLVGMISQADIARHLTEHAVAEFVESVCA